MEYCASAEFLGTVSAGYLTELLVCLMWCRPESCLWCENGGNRRNHKHGRWFEAKSLFISGVLLQNKPLPCLNIVSLCQSCAWQRDCYCLLPWKWETGKAGGIIVWAHSIQWKVEMHCSDIRSWLKIKANSYSAILELPGEEGERHATYMHVTRRKQIKVQKLLFISVSQKHILTPRDTNTGNTLSLFLSDRRREDLQSSTTSECQVHANLLLAPAVKLSQVFKAFPQSQSKPSELAMHCVIIYIVFIWYKCI